MKLLPILFILMAICCWGCYIPMIHHGQMSFGEAKAPFRAFLCVGLAYFLLAILVPGGMLLAGQEPAEFTGKGVSMSTFAGVFGALGALGVIFSLYFGAKPIYVAPVIFAGTPIVNTILTMYWDKPKSPPSPLFFVGILMAAAGAFMVLYFKPK